MNALPDRIGIFGGTFDPVHIGHMILAEWLTGILKIDTTFWVPAYIHPFEKRTDISPARDRLAMVRKAIAGFDHFKVSAIELDNKGVSFAINTIRDFKTRYPQSELYYFIGRDNLQDFLKWRDPLKILEECYLAVFNRGCPDALPKCDLEDHPKVLMVESPLIDISSTHIRQRIHKKMAWHSLVPEAVFQYINQHGLYNK